MKRLLALATIFLSIALPIAVIAATRTYATLGAQGNLAVTVESGHTANVVLNFKNIGTAAWKGTGKKYVSAYATDPYGRKSVFRDATWPTARQAARLSAASIAPGETASITFSFHAPKVPGKYVEQFKLAVENTAWIVGSTTNLTITVVPEQVTLDTAVGAKQYVVMDAETGEVLSSKDPDEVRSIASMTKLMTVMVAHDAGLDPNLTVQLVREDEVGGGRLRVRYGTKLTVHELVASAIIGSANNAANAIARSTGLQPSDFIARMDAKARTLGLTQTSFSDPTGIDVPNVSTAREVAVMARAAFNDPWIAEFAGQPTYDVITSAGPHHIKNTNKLTNDGSITVVAGKTGFIYEAGYTLVTRLRREGRHDLIVSVMGCDTASQPFRDARILAEKGWLAGTTLAVSR
jgi:D-alanyl-D-alanine endopeptidase (penicillin-binding protein 7)